ncbi:MAG TPA: lipocalin family protein [Gemmatimonadales bacterium]
MRAPCRMLSVSLGIALAACGDGGTAPDSSTFEGTWVATKVEYTSVANPATKVDVISLGGTLTVQFNAGGSYSSVMTVPGDPQQATNGTWSASVDVFTLHWVESGITNEMQFDYTLSGNTLTLVGADSDFDFAGTDTFVAAKLNVTLVRQ